MYITDAINVGISALYLYKVSSGRVSNVNKEIQGDPLH